MSELSHDEAVEELAGVVLDAADAQLADAVRAHAAVCPECGPELDAMQESVSVIGRVAPGVAMYPGRNAGIRSRLIMRARADRDTRAPTTGTADPSRGVASLRGLGYRATPGAQRAVSGEYRQVSAASVAGSTAVGRRINPGPVHWLAMAAVLALIATGAQLVRVTAQRNMMRAELLSMDTLPRSDSMTAIAERKDAMIAAMAGPDVRIISLGHRSSAQPMGRLLWNRASNDWILVTYGMEQPRPGMTYQLWLATDEGRISGGTFRPDREGRAVMHTQHEIARDGLRSVAITEEPEGGMRAPTGRLIAGGAG